MSVAEAKCVLMMKMSKKTFDPCESFYNSSIDAEFLYELNNRPTYTSPEELLINEFGNSNQQDISHLIEIGDKVSAPITFLKRFATTNIPTRFKGSKEEYASLIQSYYAETLADNYLDGQSNETAHDNALFSAYAQVFQLKDK